jgi:protein TonB
VGTHGSTLALLGISRHTRQQVLGAPRAGGVRAVPMEHNRGTPNGGTEADSPSVPDEVLDHQQRRRMLVALLVLVLALISVLVKDRQFWFPPTASTESEIPEQSPPRSIPVPPARLITPVAEAKPAAPAPVPARSRAKRVARTTPPDDAQASAGPIITATNRAVLPPLEVEVVAGNQRRTVSPADSSVKVEMQSAPSAASEQTNALASQNSSPSAANFAARVQMSPGTAQVVSRPVDPTYPLLAKQMKVQGAVVLQALISKTGSIQDIQVLSGPAILSEAAREAVKQWHFKPYYQGGQAVETEARITVNFTISTY